MRGAMKRWSYKYMHTHESSIMIEIKGEGGCFERRGALKRRDRGYIDEAFRLRKVHTHEHFSYCCVDNGCFRYIHAENLMSTPAAVH